MMGQSLDAANHGVSQLFSFADALRESGRTSLVGAKGKCGVQVEAESLASGSAFLAAFGFSSFLLSYRISASPQPDLG